MTNRVLLNNIDHLDLRVTLAGGADFGDLANQIPVFPTEYEDIQREYPIVFRKDDEGRFHSFILTGLDRDENLFFADGLWQARYIPAIQQRGPFSIALQERESAGERQTEPMIFIDLDDPRVGKEDGAPLFLPQGGNSPYLEHVAAVLRLIYQGTELNGPMFEAFVEFDLMEPVMLELQISETETYKFPNVFTISPKRLAQLQGKDLERMHRTGFLRAAYFALSSLANVNRLIELKNRRRLSE